jgi:hypothetical protein
VFGMTDVKTTPSRGVYIGWRLEHPFKGYPAWLGSKTPLQGVFGMTDVKNTPSRGVRHD